VGLRLREARREAEPAEVEKEPVGTLNRVQPNAGIETLPGGDLVRRGVADLATGDDSAAALLVSIGAPRLRSLGLELPTTIDSPEHKLYELIAREKGDAAHSTYNALIRRLVSFERAAACAI
jgi:hypothetical protein